MARARLRKKLMAGLVDISMHRFGAHPPGLPLTPSWGSRKRRSRAADTSPVPADQSDSTQARPSLLWLLTDAGPQWVKKPRSKLLNKSREDRLTQTNGPDPASSSTTPRPLFPTEESEGVHAALFNQLFGASPTTSPRASTPDKKANDFDLNVTPPGSPVTP